MGDLSPANLMLGIGNKKGLKKEQNFLRQSEYAKEILYPFRMVNSKQVATPMDKSYHALVNQKAVPGNGDLTAKR